MPNIIVQVNKSMPHFPAINFPWTKDKLIERILCFYLKQQQKSDPILKIKQNLKGNCLFCGSR